MFGFTFKMLEKEDISNVGIEDNDGLDIDLMDKMTRMSLCAKKTDDSEQDNESTMSDLSLNNPLFADDRLSSKVMLNTFTLLIKYLLFFQNNIRPTKNGAQNSYWLI